MENNKRKIKIKHRILATICLALFCGVVFIAHYKPIKTYADNDTDNHYRMPSGIYLSYYDGTTSPYNYPLYAYDGMSSFNTGMIDLSTGAINYLSLNTIQAPLQESLATATAYLYPSIVSGIPNPAVKRIQITISDFYCEKFNSTQFIPMLVSVYEDTGGAYSLPLCNVFIRYDVFNFSNGIYQLEQQSYIDLDLNSEAILVNKVFNESYFAPEIGMLHFKDITILIDFDEIFDDTGFLTTIEFYRATNDSINTYNDILYEHTWEEVEVSVNYLQSFYDTVSGFLTIELLPNFSIGTMLELAIAIPLVVWFLKSWLGG